MGLADCSWVETRSVTRKPEDEQWNSEKIAAITALPGERRERAARPRVRFENAALDQEATAVEVPPNPGRQLRISKADIEKYGYDDECAQRQHFQKYRRGKTGREHTKRCRARLMTAIDGTEEGKRRLEEYQERANRSFAEHIEWQDKHRVPPTIRVPQEFRPIRDVETMRPIVEPHRPETRPHMPEEPGSGLPSGSGREERSTEPPRGDMTDYGWDDAGLPIEQPHSEDVEMEFVGAHTPRADIGILEPDSVDEESTQTLARIGCSAERAPTSHRK